MKKLINVFFLNKIVVIIHSSILFFVAPIGILGQTVSAMEKYIDIVKTVDSPLQKISNDTLLLYCDSILQYDSNTVFELAYASLMKGYILRKMHTFDSAMFYLNNALKLSTSIDSTYARALVNIALIYDDIGQSDSALIFHNQALKIYIQNHDSLNIAKVHSNISTVYSGKGIYDKALQWALESKHIYSEYPLSQGYYFSLINTANVYEMLEQYTKALILYELCYNTGKKNGYNDIAYKSLINQGVIFYRLVQFEKSKVAFLDAISYYEKHNDRSELSLLYSNISLVYKKLGQSELSIEYLERALSIAVEIQHIKGQIRALNNLAIAYKNAKKYVKAEKYYKKSLLLAQQSGYKDDISKVYINLSNLYKIMDKPDDALEYYILYHTMSDSILNEKKIATIAELQLKYEKMEDETLILNLEKESAVQQATNSDLRRQRNIIIGSGATVAIILFMSLMFLRVRNMKNKEIAKQKIQLLEDEKKLLAAQSILTGQEEERKRISQELHDGIGVLLSTASIHFSNITGSSGDKELDGMLVKANDMIKQAGNEVRKISHNMMPGVLSNFGLFDALEDLFDEVDESGAIVVSHNMQGDDSRLNERTEIMVYRIMQELINNTLKHAKANNVKVDLQREISKLKISYVDDGVGFNYQSKQLDKSLGLSGISSRVDFLHGTLNVVTSRGKGCSYNIVVPL
ncbi:MAG: sensor histidine kinase [Pseudomonadota bacterium]